MHANGQLWHCSWMFKYGSKHDVHIMDFASDPVSKVIYNQAGIWSLFLSNITEGLLESSGMLAQTPGSIFRFFQDSARTSFLQCFMRSASNDQVNSPEPGVCFQIWVLLHSLPKVNVQLSCAKELSQIIAGWCVRADSSLCLDKRNTKSFD